MSFSPEQTFAIALLIAFAAALYSSVGHGGASGYLAILSFFSLTPEVLSSTALMLNVLVAGIGTIQFIRAGHFFWKLAWPFVCLSIPSAFAGGLIEVTAPLYSLLLALVLLFAASRLFRRTPEVPEGGLRSPSKGIAVAGGSGIGFLSGIVGVGGGIFLSPLMILMRWATTKQTAAVSAFFIVVNSLAGLAGRVVRGGMAVESIWPFVFAAFIGGSLGSFLGASTLTSLVLRRVLAVVLLIASGKLIMTSAMNR